jgi:hypothetical protein
MVAIQLYRELVSPIHGSQLYKGISYTGIWIQLNNGIRVFNVYIYSVYSTIVQQGSQSHSFYSRTPTVQQIPRFRKGLGDLRRGLSGFGGNFGGASSW